MSVENHILLIQIILIQKKKLKYLKTLKIHDNIEVGILRKYLDSGELVGTYFINLTTHKNNLRECKNPKSFKDISEPKNQALNKYLKDIFKINCVILILSIILPYLAVYAVVL